MAFNIDISGMGEQFRGLNGRHPGLWPVVPRATLLTAIFAVLLGLAYVLYWQGLFEELQIGEAKEKQLKTQFQEKMKMAVNLEVLREQKVLVTKYVSGLEKQLPSKAEMDALLSDINQAGVGRSLQFELFKPGQVVIRDYYAELPINIRLSGRFHDLAAFTSDISNLSRIVTLNELSIAVPARDATGMLTMEAVAKTYRYLDPEEVSEQRRLANLKNPKSKKRGAK
ncbi:MAG: type 4a pilus biogenesis protein PilO [Burkholderiaceae bacterium]|nr:type 4a pilus biogenesis protein PilO [Burkholderiaceae bacterium]